MIDTIQQAKIEVEEGLVPKSVSGCLLCCGTQLETYLGKLDILIIKRRIEHLLVSFFFVYNYDVSTWTHAMGDEDLENDHLGIFCLPWKIVTASFAQIFQYHLLKMNEHAIECFHQLGLLWWAWGTPVKGPFTLVQFKENSNGDLWLP
ncbi:hypothetical protein OIU85_021743 [Salix viminalis]|uniref:Uncharacterized protein n=1 Tax=Salix viminalis TaxID=40686 RepID=A0A9Q0UJ80_SALVM|nr:hypothetical protein OIU85_021743 [Salix viminalis]